MSTFRSVNPSRKSIVFSSAVFSVDDFLIGNRNWTKAVSIDPGVFRHFATALFYCTLYKEGKYFFFLVLDDRCRSTDINFCEDDRAVTQT